MSGHAMPDTLSPGQLAESLRPGMTVFVAGMSGESTVFYQALQARPELAAGVRFVGALFPGINRSDYLGLAPDTRQRAYFMQPGLRKGLQDGRAELVPLDYPGIFRDLEQLPIDLAIVQASPPDARGRCSLGISCDFQPAALARAGRRIAHINPLMPRTQGSFVLNCAELDGVLEAGQELIGYDAGTPGPDMRKHAGLVASLVRDGDTLEFGVGKLQAGILSALCGHRRLRVWSGMASSPILPLIDQGVIGGIGAVSVGVALGDRVLYERAGRDDTFFFRPVSETHDARKIAVINQFCAINSAIEVDLFGQANAESVDGRLVAGVGGLPAFVSGALQSSAGRSIIALPSTAEDGRSRIVGRLSPRCLTALPRHLADYVVTEHGIASLRHRSMQERAAELIRIAAPQHREALSAQWHDDLKAA
jgi:acyl-CoA hydrolase